MGGGDLNTKKAWHPSTLKNQERVWKAEQAAAEEQKRIAELQRERAQERDREELNKISKQNCDAGGSDNRLSWMYDQKPDKKVQQEDYLLGKAIDKNYNNAGKSEQNEIPAVSRRVVGSSMITSGGDTQVDMARKLREDPLLLVKERERAARAALLNNPVQRKKLTELLRKEQEQKNQKSERKLKKKKKDIDNLLAAKLNALGGEKGMNIAKLLESSDDSSSDSSSEKNKSKKKKKKKKSKSKKHKHESDSGSPVRHKKSKSKVPSKGQDDDSENESSRIKRSKYEIHKKSVRISKSNTENTDDSDAIKSSHKTYRRDYSHSKSPERLHRYYGGSSIEPEERKKHRYSDSSPARNERTQQRNRKSSSSPVKRGRQRCSDSSPDQQERRHRKRIESSPDRKDRKQRRLIESSQDRKEKQHKKSVLSFDKKHNKEIDSNRDLEGRRAETKRPALSEEEKNARLAAMAAAGAEREVQRGRRVAAQLAENAAAEKQTPRYSSQNEARVLPDSLESRIHSNRHYIQRDKRHMNEHFARRQ